MDGAAAAFGMGRHAPDEEVVADLPPMRAVSLMSQPSLRDSGTSPKFTKAPPLGLSRPAPIGARGASSSFGVKQEWSDVAVNCNWEVCDLEQVPVDFPLERTHREISGTDATEVAKRISKALRMLSIEAEYDGEKAKAKCRTSDLVSFRIRLFAGGEDGLPVVVELQRRNGSASSFMRSCRAILDAAEGKEVRLSQARPKAFPFMGKPISEMKCLSAVITSDGMSAGRADLERSMEMLRSKKRDTNMLGLQNLCNLTDPLKTRPSIATTLSKDVVLAHGDSDIREEIAVMLQRDVFQPGEYEEDTAPTQHKESCRHLALVLFSNALALTSKDGSLENSVKTQKWFSDFLIPSLLDEVKSAPSSANTAYEAACGLTSLASCSDIARRVMVENGAIEILREGHSYGLQFHELLASESQQCLSAIGETSIA